MAVQKRIFFEMKVEDEVPQVVYQDEARLG